MYRFLRRLFFGRRGATAIEYGLLAGLLAVATIGAITTIGTTLNTEFNTVATNISSAGG